MASYASGSPEADAATRADTAIAAGAGNHLPIGYWSGAQYRSAMRFAKPPWAGWTAITKATLSFYISDHQHVGVRNSSIYVRKTQGASPWTKAAGTQDCESGFSGSNTTQYADLDAVSTNQVSFASGTTANAKKSVDVTAMVQTYWAGDQKPVFIFDPVGAGDYTELWSDERSGYNAALVIEYESAAPPLAPTLTAPAAGAVVTATKPVFTWTHNDPDAQSAAEVQLYDNAGVAIGAPQAVAGAVFTLTWPTDLVRGTTYKWAVRTSDAVSGFGPFSAQQSFTIASLPVVTVSATRQMTFDASAHQPRLVVNWTCDQAQASYRVTTASGYDSGLIAGAATSHVIARNLTNGTAETVTVAVTATSTLTGSASRAFTPRWGLTTHRKDLVTAPTGWLSPTIVQTPVPDANVVMEYGSDSAANAVPSSGWFASPGVLPRQRYLYWRAWFIPSATASPVLDRVDIPVSAQVQLVDKWGTTRDVAGLVAPWSVDVAEAVYGTRSLRADVSGAGPFRVYSFKVKLRANRTYILTGLMKSKGNSGAKFQLEDGAGNVLLGGGMLVPAGSPVTSPALTADTDWYDLTKRDTNRYKTPTYPAGADMDAYVVLSVGGTAGAIAWFDAIKLEESTVATPWSPAAIGAVVIDAGGVQIDGNKGGVLRYKGSNGGLRDVVEGGTLGLKFGTDTELASPSTGVLTINGVPVGGSPPIVRLPATGTNWVKPAGLAYIVVEVVGGGGGGGGAGATAAGQGAASGGGGAGGYARKTFLASALPATVPVVVGAGGAAGSSAGGGGGVGGVSSFTPGGALAAVVGNPGAGGAGHTASAASVSTNGGAGGTATGGDVNVPGGDGGRGELYLGVRLFTAYGGGNPLGAASPPTATVVAAANPYGSGGGGQTNSASAGAIAGNPGGVGVVIVTEYY